ncbi:MAG: hypothetical protein ACXAD7_04690 [Candidatus Kariarchaeaceae archaeon]|jgi:hypothetical protein
MDNLDDLGETITKHVLNSVKHALKGCCNLEGLGWHTPFSEDFPIGDDFHEGLNDTIFLAMECVTDVIEQVADVLEDIFD